MRELLILPLLKPRISLRLLLRLLLPLLLPLALTAQDSLNVRHLSHWDDPSVPIGSQFLFNRYNEVWGHAAGDREYAILGSTLGIHFIDITDPAAPIEVDRVLGRFSGEGVVHRDMKVHAGHVYAVCDQGASSLQIIDLQHLPDSVHVVYDSDEILVRAHNIQIDTVNARLYTNGGSTQFSVISIADPTQPVLLSDLEADVPWWNNSIGYVHDCFVRDNIVWVNDEDGMHVVDFTDPLDPIILGSLTDYPFAGYNHSGWMNDDGTLYVMADETHGSPLKFVDATDLSDLQVISTVSPGTHPLSVVHNPFFTGDLVHVAYYLDGYYLWDASDPFQPQLLGFYDMNQIPHIESYMGAWGVYPYLPSGRVLVSDMQSGLWVLDIDQAVAIKEASDEAFFSIAPTLSTGKFIIRSAGSIDGTAMIRIFDAAGRSVQQIRSQMDNIEMDLGGANDGIYFIRIEAGDRIFTQRIMKIGNR